MKVTALLVVSKPARSKPRDVATMSPSSRTLPLEMLALINSCRRSTRWGRREESSCCSNMFTVTGSEIGLQSHSCSFETQGVQEHWLPKLSGSSLQVPSDLNIAE